MPEPINVEVAKLLIEQVKTLIEAYVDKGPAIPSIVGKVTLIQLDSVLDQLE